MIFNGNYTKKILPEYSGFRGFAMIRFIHMITGAILLALVFNIGAVTATDVENPQADLNISKVVSSTGPYEPGDEITWNITLWNNGPGNATNISLTEDDSDLPGLVYITGVADQGVYNNTTKIWNITELKNSTFTTLSVITKFNTPGKKINNININALDQTDPESGNNHAEANVVINAAAVIPDAPLSVNLAIRPTTLNLKSKGVFTVYLTGGNSLFLADNSKKSRIDYANSSLTCSGAEMIRASVSNKDGGTLIAKFHRADLENVTPGKGVEINCSGTLSVNGKSLSVEGSDTIRVIGEKKGLDSVLSRLWKFLGIEKDDIEINESEDGNITVSFTLNPENFKNPGQVKKLFKNQGNESDNGIMNETGISEQTRGQKEETAKNNKDNQKIRDKNAFDKQDEGNNGANKRDAASPGKSNGKKDGMTR
jgi:uncharacterized repeat protein (TIGR01451 family)